MPLGIKIIARFNIAVGLLGALPNLLYGGWSFLAGFFPSSASLMYLLGGFLFIAIGLAFSALFWSGILILNLNSLGRKIILRASPLIAGAVYLSLSLGVGFFHGVEPAVIAAIFFIAHVWYLNLPSVKQLFIDDKPVMDSKYLFRQAGVAVLTLAIAFCLLFPFVEMYKKIYDKAEIKKFDFNGKLINEGDYGVAGFTGIRKLYSKGRVTWEWSYVNGKEEGITRILDDKGNPRIERMILDGKDLWEKTYEDGKLKAYINAESREALPF